MSSEIPDTLEECTWEQISKLSRMGSLLDYFSIGDTKSIKLNGIIGDNIIFLDDLKIYAVLIGYNHNPDFETQNLAHFEIGKYLNSGQIAFYSSNNNGFPMQTDVTNVGGWDASFLRKIILGNDEEHTPDNPLENSFMAALPRDLRMVMQSNNKYSFADDSPDSLTISKDYLSLFSEKELIGGNGSHIIPYEATYNEQYDFYKLGNSKQHYQHTTLATVGVWTRSQSSSSTQYFCLYTSAGASKIGSVTSKYGISPIFYV